MSNDILSNFFKGKTTYDETIKNIEDLMIEQIEEEVKDCTNCDYGKYNDMWDLHFCYCPEDCKNWNKWKENKNK